MRKKKNKKYKKVIFNLIVYMILLLVLVYSGVKIYKWYKQIQKIDLLSEDAKNEDLQNYLKEISKAKEVWEIMSAHWPGEKWTNQLEMAIQHAR